MIQGFFYSSTCRQTVEGCTLNCTSLAAKGMESIFYSGEREVETNDVGNPAPPTFRNFSVRI